MNCRPLRPTFIHAPHPPPPLASPASSQSPPRRRRIAVADELLIVDGAAHLSFESLTFEHAAGWVRVPHYGQDQAAIQQDRAAIHIRGQSRHVSFRNVSVRQCGAFGTLGTPKSLIKCPLYI